MKKIFIIFFLLLSAFLFAQKNDSLPFPGLHFKGGKWRLDEKKIGRRQVEDSLLKVDQAMIFYKKGRTNRTIDYISIISAATFSWLGKESTDIGSPSFGKRKWGFKITSLLSSMVCIYEIIRFGKNYKKAARYYNEKRFAVY